MKSYVLLFFLFYISIGTSQKSTVIDKNSKQIIPFANFVADSIAVYSNENGMIDLKEFNLETMITISSIGYQSKKVKKNEIQEVLYLEPVDYVLSPIVIVSDERIVETTKGLKDSKKLGSQILPCHTNVFTKVVPNEQLLNKRISSINLPFDRHSGMSKKQKEIYKNSKLLIRLNFFKVDGDSLGELIYSSETFNIITGDNKDLSVSLKNKELRFLKDGFYIQLESLGAVDDEGEFLDCNSGLFMARAKISDKESKDYKIESYNLSVNGQMDITNHLNYAQVFGQNDLDKNFFLNYQFTYYK